MESKAGDVPTQAHEGGPVSLRFTSVSRANDFMLIMSSYHENAIGVWQLSWPY